MFLVIGQSNGPLQKKTPSKHAPTINYYGFARKYGH
jgi:hypothetical protein